MEYTDKEFCLEVWGDYACFTRPEFKVERVSYDVITPSAARAIFESIFWKPAIRWEVSKIEVLSPIVWTNIRRNEVGAYGHDYSGNSIFIDGDGIRQQRMTQCLKHVHYRIWAKLIFIPIRNRKYKESKNPNNDRQETDLLRKDENPTKYNAMFERRARKGQCFTTPYLGNREFSAYFKLIENEEECSVSSLKDTDKELGIMFYDWDYSNDQALFFDAKMTNGIIMVPTLEEIKKMNYDTKSII